MIVPVILCGGSGTRLWPLSRSQYPKQFLSLTGSLSLLQQTVQRLQVLQMGKLMCIANESHRFLLAEQLHAMDVQADIFLEPEGRNTAPAIALAALHVLAQDADAQVLVMPADHYMEDSQEFATAVQQASLLSADDYLVTFGIKPNSAHTGYGYIQCGEPLGSGFQVQQFVEKPDAFRAQTFIEADDDYYWNAGIFLFKARVILEAMQKLCPDIVHACRAAYKKAKPDLNFMRLDEGAWSACAEDSIDYAVMEKADNVAVIPMDCVWSDIGSFSSLWEILPKDEHGNVLHGEIINIDSSGNLVHTHKQQVVALVGMQNTVVIESKDALLVADKAHAQAVKKVVDELKQHSDQRTDLHMRVYRPWGWYESLSMGDGYQVKRIQVNAGAKLSLQKHRYRSEHWVVIRGCATVVCDEDTQQLLPGQSTYIPLGAVHQLANDTEDMVEVIETQIGDYLGEDDIIRLEDYYNRA